MAQPKKTPLTVEVKNGQLNIRVGIGVLAHAAGLCDRWVRYNEDKCDYEAKWRITDNLQFAKDVKCAMLDEAEDGSSPLTRFLDKACLDAVEQGSEAVEDL